MPQLRSAPAWRVAALLNAGGLGPIAQTATLPNSEAHLDGGAPFSLKALRGRVIFAVAFQMLCPGCVSHALPQAMRVRSVFDSREVVVLGLHAVFEHHIAQGGRAALEAFLHEYRITFPVAIDAPSPDGGVPLTMHAYAMQGTPTIILIDRAGKLRLQRFGHIDDLTLGASIQALLSDAAPASTEETATSGSCEAGACSI